MGRERMIRRLPDGAPRPEASLRHEPGPDGVLADVLERRGEPWLTVDDAGIESAAEEVSRAAVSAVEPLRVDAAQKLDAS